MNSEELWTTTMDPARRLLKRVTLEESSEADGMFSILMGSSVEARRSFIEAHAVEVRNSGRLTRRHGGADSHAPRGAMLQKSNIAHPTCCEKSTSGQMGKDVPDGQYVFFCS